MNSVSFADVVHQAVTFSLDLPEEALVVRLIDTPWVQRLRDISQTANTRLVYMFSEHSRFGHCIGVAYLASLVLKKLEARHPELVRPHKGAVLAAALLHDIGHLAPGSHVACKTWFPDQDDLHEDLAAMVCRQDPQISSVLRAHSAKLPDEVARIIQEDPSLPPWTWELLSGGGWNVDRGNWCVVDSVLAGVQYGHYNIPALTESLEIGPDQRLALRENRLDAMMHFAMSRHAMYRQVYQHRVILSADTLNQAVVRRARDIESSLEFADTTMHTALRANSMKDLPLETAFQMREAWWRYHMYRWSDSSDPVLRDLANRIIQRKLFKTVRIHSDNEEQVRAEALKALRTSGYDPRYYFHEISTVDVHGGDSRQSLQVLLDSGGSRPLAEADPLFHAMTTSYDEVEKRWIVVPAEVKAKLQWKR